jgi:hypothetical protein
VCISTTFATSVSLACVALHVFYPYSTCCDSDVIRRYRVTRSVAANSDTAATDRLSQPRDSSTDQLTVTREALENERAPDMPSLPQVSLPLVTPAC